ncbi:MAG TPA: hypothetical protein VJ508_02095, partial [Saprospiraceae bacterium]|nr:hypothetical protein [Saprospiraceae bacterium]
MQKPHPRLWPVLVVLLSLLAAWAIFNVYLYEPNRHMYAFGGDALMHYYDIVYHVTHDHGTTLGGMNYPYGEYVFLTDAQGAVSTVLQWINHHVADIHPYVLGILHSLNIYLLPLCSLFVFYILRFFQVRMLTSVLFAVLITFLSPAMLRFGAHFGLAYPFVIPMAMLWYLRKTK